MIGNVPESVVHHAHQKGALYGAYYNNISAKGMSATFNGVVVPEAQIPAQSVANGFLHTASYPTIVSQGYGAIAYPPDNFVSSPKTFLFYEAGAVKSKITEEDAVKR